jgi:RNA polymerase-interacting CarD/CdnL/TRCF family regulator
MGTGLFQSGELVYHPRYGFGTVTGIAQQNLGKLVHDDKASAAEDYYEIDLRQSGTLLVPVARVDTVGLRRLTNGLTTIEACLASPPEALIEDGRQRMVQLRAWEQSPEPEALLRAVRDLAAIGRARGLSASEQKWLDQACRRLATEAALVDDIAEVEARAAVWQVVSDLCARQS